MITMLSIYKQTLVIWNISTKYTRVMLESPLWTVVATTFKYVSSILQKVLLTLSLHTQPSYERDFTTSTLFD